MTNRLAELMSMQDRGAKLARNVLTRAFRDMLKELGVDYEYLTILTEVYLKDPSRQIDLNDHNKLANDRGNVKKEMEKDEYTIKVFMKLMRLLRLKELAITFHGTWHDGKQLNNGEGLKYIIDLDLESVDDIEIPDNLKESFYKTVESLREIDGLDEPPAIEDEEREDGSLVSNF